ncbi:hypothetical protein ABFS82_12G036300 [Erythranthe guttata]
MVNSLRALLRAQAASLFSYSLPTGKYSGAGGAVRFAQVVSGSGQPGAYEKPDRKEGHKSDTGVSSGGYAKRSDEEGFGAEYGGNQSLSKDDEDKIVHGNSPEYEQSKKSS